MFCAPASGIFVRRPAASAGGLPASPRADPRPFDRRVPEFFCTLASLSIITTSRSPLTSSTLNANCRRSGINCPQRSCSIFEVQRVSSIENIPPAVTLRGRFEFVSQRSLAPPDPLPVSLLAPPPIPIGPAAPATLAIVNFDAAAGDVLPLQVLGHLQKIYERGRENFGNMEMTRDFWRARNRDLQERRDQDPVHEVQPYHPDKFIRVSKKNLFRNPKSLRPRASTRPTYSRTSAEFKQSAHAKPSS